MFGRNCVSSAIGSLIEYGYITRSKIPGKLGLYRATLLLFRYKQPQTIVL